MPGAPIETRENDAFALAAVEDSVAALTETSTREERFAVAVSMVQLGSCVNSAAAATGLDSQTLWRYLRGETKSMAAKEERIIEMALEGTILASNRILTRLAEGSMSAKDELKALQVMRETVAKKFGWGESASPGDGEKRSPLKDLLLVLREGIAIGKQQEGGAAIDVTPEGDKK